MVKYIKIFFTGMLISFIGSLPLGTLNLTAMQISMAEGYGKAIWFAIGTLLVEVIYVRLSLVAMDKITKQQKILRALEWVTLLIIAALAITTLIAAAKGHPKTQNILLSSNLPRFLLGTLMSALNPVQIPFWFGWSTVLFTKKILLPSNNHYNYYISGIGTGTFFATGVFIFGGKLIVEKLNANQNNLNWTIGFIFAGTALLQLWKMLRKKDAIAKMELEDKIDLNTEKFKGTSFRKEEG